EHQNICVVGDADQSIYKWRGADIRNILDFEHDYPGTKVIKLEQNYRSTQRILSLAAAVIDHNRQRKEKTLWTENAEGDKPKLYRAWDEHEEATRAGRSLLAVAADPPAVVTGTPRRSLEEFAALMGRLAERRAEMTTPAFIDHALNATGYRDTLRAERSPEAETRLENLEEL